jgi:L-threonylcarbamoyladenylate synthase
MVDFEKDIEQCLQVLKTGGLILYPTDTIWGIGCDATNAEAVEKIYKLKKRSDEKAMIVLVADEKDVLNHVAAPDLQVFDHLQHTKKPTAVIYEGAIGLADNLVAKDGTVAIRICHDEFCRNLLKRFRKPIVSTSANISGAQVARIFDEVTDEIKNAVDHIVKYRQEDTVISEPSSVIRWNKDGSITLLRP